LSNDSGRDPVEEAPTIETNADRAAKTRHVAHNVLRLTLDREGLPALVAGALEPEQWDAVASALGVRPDELATQPQELQARLLGRIAEANALASGAEALSALDAVRRDAARLGLPVPLVEATLALARRHRAQGELTAAIVEALVALANVRNYDEKLRIDAAILLGALLHDAGQNALAAAIFAGVIRDLPLDARDRRRALVNWGTALGQLGSYAASHRVYGECVDAARTAGDPRLEAWALVGQAAAAAHLGDHARMEDHARRALELAEVHGWADVAEQIEATRQWWRAAHAGETDTGALPRDPNLLDNLAMDAYRRGDYARCRACADAGLGELDAGPAKPLALEARLVWWRALAAHALGDPCAALYRRWAEDLFQATFSSPVQQDLPPWPSNGS
jgi:tetratricopeptide (TPR) repeat protein